MGKAIGCFVGIVAFSLFAEGVGIFLFAIAIMLFAGTVIGENDALLMIYVIGAMMASYLLPIALSVYTKSILWLIVTPIVTSLLFAFPSSFAYDAGCKAGNQEAVWAMRAIPVVWIVETIMATDSDDLPSECQKLQHQN